MSDGTGISNRLTWEQELLDRERIQQAYQERLKKGRGGTHQGRKTAK